MKIFHMGDWHIGKLVNGFYMTEDQEFIIEKIYEAIKKEKPDVVVIAGDLYDRSVPPVHAVELLNKTMKKIVKDLNTKVIALAGNHDSNERVEFASSLLCDSGLYIVGNLKRKIDKIVLEDEYGKVNFYPIPYADVPVVRDLFEDENIKTHDLAMQKIISEILNDFNEDERNIAVAHGYVTQMKEDNFEALEESDSEKPLSIGGTEYINSKHFEKFNYTALGHLHGPQKVGSDKIRYSGSLMKYSFSEVNQKKGITIVDIDENGDVDIEIYNLKPRRDFRVKTGTLEEIIKGFDNSSENYEDYIKVILKDKGELLDPMAKLRSIYPNVMELTREERVSRNSSRNVATNIKEKSKITLFKNFYEDIMDECCSEEEINVIEKIIEASEKGGE
ncbi:exonuclease SbcCD subunit D [Clostridium tertium]|jgi:DNA repair protein SbcD/Mre11|uniref:Nuclease SbcCD subunit D n=1 Tax=Clostridium tertium TaxID=1559 RepID=A0A9X3XNY4_9CLOT|nr:MULTISPECIES: exonuclease SbcCD subunit D [Clostridium]EEH98867.1 exonuclease SbcCD, D subunit [Clostridium sp. 7_2_43FAA]MBS5885950.1 exonuclease SbcCD subunit D [Clostridium sp.]MBU6136151.1 exonuclease SbcCD subunit D [Clostridium tertium]MDB1941238.1 exonuclease SbcCD subunit D [Clostridium tertium]MDB1946573.1 exonuclease SbcCD subunit D [Clostridium tertium]